MIARLGEKPMDPITSASQVMTLRMDDRKGAYKAVDHLASLGHQRIAFFDAGDPSGIERMKTSIEVVQTCEDICTYASRSLSN